MIQGDRYGRSGGAVRGWGGICRGQWTLRGRAGGRGGGGSGWLRTWVTRGLGMVVPMSGRERAGEGDQPGWNALPGSGVHRIRTRGWLDDDGGARHRVGRIMCCWVQAYMYVHARWAGVVVLGRCRCATPYGTHGRVHAHTVRLLEGCSCYCMSARACTHTSELARAAVHARYARLSGRARRACQLQVYGTPAPVDTSVRTNAK